MLIVVDGLGDVDPTEVDLGSLIEFYDITDWEVLQSAVIQRVARLAREGGISVNDMWVVNFTHDETDAHTQIDTGAGQGRWEQWEEVARLAVFLHGKDEEVTGPVLALLTANLWKYFDFDDVENSLDEFSQEYDGDVEAFGQEWADSCESIPDNLVPYIDWEKYGQDVLDSYQELEWNGTTYLFHQ